MKISFITTVLNEEETIKSFLESLSEQTKVPDEIIIVDGGSSDRTVAKIKSTNQKLKILVKKGNRSVGRNEAIKNATGQIIVCSDSGCVLDKNWVKKISEPFLNSKVDVVAGFYRPISKNIFQKCLASYTCVMDDKIDLDNFLPSSRSIAFKKNAWKTVGGYPEEINTCEDLIFARKLKKKNLVFKFLKEALVYWPQRENLPEAFKQFFNYAEGDGEGLYFRFQTPFLFARYILGLIFLAIIFQTKSLNLSIVFLFLCLLYLTWATLKNYKYTKSWQALFILPSLQITSDIAVLLGTTKGMIKRVFKS